MWAQYSLGITYFDGKGVEPDYKEAVKWYSLAAAKGHDKAQYYLGGCVLNGQGTERNIEAAVGLFQMSAKQGNTDAMDILNELKSMGIK